MSSAPHKGFHSPGAPLEAGVTQADHPLPRFQTRSMIPDAESVLTQAQPMSTADGERTLIPSPSAAVLGSSVSMFPLLPSATATPGSKFLKRKRESFADEPQLSEDMNMDEEPHVQRSRTEIYTLCDDPSGLGWFLLPFKAFVKGFKQSLTNSWSRDLLLCAQSCFLPLTNSYLSLSLPVNAMSEYSSCEPSCTYSTTTTKIINLE